MFPEYLMSYEVEYFEKNKISEIYNSANNKIYPLYAINTDIRNCGLYVKDVFINALIRKNLKEQYCNNNIDTDVLSELKETASIFEEFDEGNQSIETETKENYSDAYEEFYKDTFFLIENNVFSVLNIYENIYYIKTFVKGGIHKCFLVIVSNPKNIVFCK